MLDKSIKRFALLLILIYLFLTRSGYTAADIFAERKVSKNKLTAVTLDLFAIESFNNFNKQVLFDYSSFLPGGYAINSLRVKSQSSGVFKYVISVKKIDGDENFCRSLKIKVLDLDFDKIQEGDLLDLRIVSEVKSERVDDWIFKISLDNYDHNLSNKICKFDLDIKTYYDTPSENGGIFAQKTISNVISSGTW